MGDADRLAAPLQQRALSWDLFAWLNLLIILMLAALEVRVLYTVETICFGLGVAN